MNDYNYFQHYQDFICSSPLNAKENRGQQYQSDSHWGDLLLKALPTGETLAVIEFHKQNFSDVCYYIQKYFEKTNQQYSNLIGRCETPY